MYENLLSTMSVLLVTASVTSSGRALASPEDHKPGTELPVVNCPVMGEPANMAQSVATDEGPVFICCKGCARKLKAEPEKYASAVAEQRQALAGRPKVQVKCPVSGEPADPKVSIEHEGTTVHFCCASCIDKYKADPEKYKSALANSYTYQTKCPVMGETISPKAFTELPTGETVYFCCKGCDKKLMAEPAKYAANLADQGYQFNWAEIMKAKHDEGHTHGGHGHDHDHDHDH